MVSMHADGTPCKEGTTSTPRGFVPCCAAFAAHLATCEFDVRYEWRAKRRRWEIAVPQVAGGGGVEIRYCPHCGAKLGRKR